MNKDKFQTIKKKVWIVFDKDGNVVGAHHGHKYIADMNALFVEDGYVTTGVVMAKLPKKRIKKPAD